MRRLWWLVTACITFISCGMTGDNRALLSIQEAYDARDTPPLFDFDIEKAQTAVNTSDRFGDHARSADAKIAFELHDCVDVLRSYRASHDPANADSYIAIPSNKTAYQTLSKECVDRIRSELRN